MKYWYLNYVNFKSFNCFFFGFVFVISDLIGWKYTLRGTIIVLMY